jgi:hypothetical protein
LPIPLASQSLITAFPKAPRCHVIVYARRSRTRGVFELGALKMIELKCKPVFGERIDLGGPEHVLVKASVFAEDSEAFRLVADVSSAGDRLDAVTQAVQHRQDEFEQKEPGIDGDGMWCMIEGTEPRTRLFVSDMQIEESLEIRAALLDLDRGGHLAILSIRMWLDLAGAERDHGRLDRAFLCSEAALRRSQFPYINLRTKDDSLLKLKAAHATFRSGQKVQAIAAVIQLAKTRWERLQRAWG